MQVDSCSLNMSGTQVQCLLPAVCRGCGESPVWDARQGGRLTFVDAFHSTVHCWSAEQLTGKAQHAVLALDNPRTISFYIPRRDCFNKGVAGVGKSLVELDWFKSAGYKVSINYWCNWARTVFHTKAIFIKK